MDLESKAPSIKEEDSLNLRQKDSWDKANIILKPLGGIVAAIAVVFLGYFTSSYLEKQKESESDVRLYTQLMSERERAEQSLRTTMFKEIFDRVLSQPKNNDSVENENGSYENKLKTIRTHVVGIDMISRNFHEFLDMKPLFLHIMWEIIVMRGKVKDDYIEAKKTDEYKRTCFTAGKSWNTAEPCQELLWQMKRLSQIAKRVINKQYDILSENGKVKVLQIPLQGLCKDENLRTPLSSSVCEYEAINSEANLKMKFGTKCTRNANFKISVKRAYPDWSMVEVNVKGSVKSENHCEDLFKNKEDIIEKRTFWVGNFDFPMIDNTYISAHEKYAVILDKIDRKNDFAELKFVYFPASDAGLQEKSYYQNKLLDRLINRSDLFNE